MIMINKTIKQSVECGEAELNYPIGTNLWHATIVYTYIYISYIYERKYGTRVSGFWARVVAGSENNTLSKGRLPEIGPEIKSLFHCRCPAT